MTTRGKEVEGIERKANGTKTNRGQCKKGKFKQGDKRERRVWRGGGALRGDNGGRGGDRRRKKREGGEEV